MRILITGGAGFIGHNLAKLALANGHEVRVLDDLSNGYRDNLDGLDVDFREASFLDESAVASAVDQIDTVVHLGALGSVPRSIVDPLRSHHANATGTLTVLDQARKAGVRHVISSSSSSVYGMNPALPKSEREWVRPMSPYAVSKLATEQYTLAFQQSYGLDTLAFRFFNVFGPGQRAGHVYAAVVPTFIDAILNDEPVWINGDGTNSRDFTYVGTVCEVLLDAVERKVSHPEPVNLAFGTNTSLLSLVDELKDVLGRTFEVSFRDPRAGDVPHSQASDRTLRSLFPDVVPVPFSTGLAETVEWFEGRRNAPSSSA
jgi:UDP-glucose 4-epimerase